MPILEKDIAVRDFARMLIVAAKGYDCPWCWGSGKISDGKKENTCPYCNGTGKQNS